MIISLKLGGNRDISMCTINCFDAYKQSGFCGDCLSTTPVVLVWIKFTNMDITRVYVWIYRAQVNSEHGIGLMMIILVSVFSH